MKILMFGWEFPPYNTGGLGTACYGLTKSLSKKGVDVIFVLPGLRDDLKADFVKLVGANVRVKKIKSPLAGYMTSDGYVKIQKNPFYGRNLFEEVQRFAEEAAHIAEDEDFDIIHAHDWLTIPAGIKAKQVSGKPLIIHVHATEFDRTGGNPNRHVYDIERAGMHAADKIVAVSNFTKGKIVQHYGIDPSKVKVVHNAVEFNDRRFNKKGFRIRDKNKVVLFLGRITLQKGPDYFLHAAKKVLEHDKNVKFIIAGSGDMEAYIIEKAAELGIANNVLFTGFLRGEDIDKAYAMADLYVMPSVSEPFGITPLEALRNETPVLISKQSGVSEVLNHCLKVDFWDTDEIANKILAVLRYQDLHKVLTENGSFEVRKFSWDEPAQKCIDLYNSFTGGVL